jgi:uncharacterized protein
LRIVLDTNVYISAAILGRVCEEITQTCRFSNLEVFITKDIIEELKDKLSKKFLWGKDQVKLFLESVLEFCNIIEIKEKIRFIKDDPDDDKILECAVSANCDFIISGDRHLLMLKSYKTIRVLSPADFLLLLKDKSSL